MASRNVFGDLYIENLDIGRMISLAEADPVDLLGQCRMRHAAIVRGTRQLNWELWVACYASASRIRTDPALFNDLLKRDYFDRRIYQPDISDALRLSLLVGTNADTRGPSYRKACQISKQLKRYYDDEVDPKDLLSDIIQSKGINRLPRNSETQLRDGTEIDEDFESDDLHVREVQRDSPPSGRNRGISRPNRRASPTYKKPRPAIPSSQTSKHTLSDGRCISDCGSNGEESTILEVNISETILRSILESREGSRFNIAIVHRSASGNWHEIDAIETKQTG